MTTITVSGVDYKVKFGYNCFCDTDIFDRVKEMLKLLGYAGAASDDDVSSIGKIKDLFEITRELLFLGLKKYNPVGSVQEVGDLLDEYHDEAPDGESRGILQIFTMLSEELMAEGFLSDLVVAAESGRKKKK